MNKIPELPEMPEELIEKIDDGKLAIFVGAGVSRLIGCKGWEDLSRELLNECYKLEMINFKELQSLISYNDNKQKITISYEILNANGYENSFFEIMEKSFEPNKNLKKKLDIYYEITKFGDLVLTTNSDKNCDEHYNPDRIAYRDDDFDPKQIDRTKIYHIHGSILDKKSIVFTVSQYFNRYKSEKFREFLKKVFESYTILFVGYGLSEFELLEFLFTKEHIHNNHYYLKEYYEDEINLLKYDKLYFKEMNIEVVGYSKSQRGYTQLYNVLKKWREDKYSKSHYLFDTYKFIDMTVNNYKHCEAEKVLQIIGNDEPLKRHFVGLLNKCTEPTLWFEFLYEKKFFENHNNFIDSDLYGFIQFVIDRNKKMLSPVTDLEKRVLKILDNIIESQSSNFKRATTIWEIRSFFITLCKLPFEFIEKRHIEFLEYIIKAGNSGSVDSILDSTIIERLIKSRNWELLFEFIRVIFLFDVKDNDDVTGLIEDYWLEKIITNRLDTFIRIFDIKMADLCEKIILDILSKSRSAFNEYKILGLKNIEEGNFDRYSSAFERMIIQILLKTIQSVNEKEYTRYAHKYFISEHKIFNRISIFLIDKRYELLKKTLLESENNLLDKEHIKRELFELFENHAKNFSGNEIDTILNWIENIDLSYLEEEEDESQKKNIEAYYKKYWLSPLRKSNNNKVEILYNKYNKINPVKPNHPNNHIPKFKSLNNKSPVSKNDLSKLSIDEIVDLLNSFKNGNILNNEPTIEGLAREFSSCVENTPEKFITVLYKFNKVPLIYKYYLLIGLKNALKNNKSLNLKEYLNFCNSIIKETNTWTSEHENDTDYNFWMVSEIVDSFNEIILNEKIQVSTDNIDSIINDLNQIIECGENVIIEYKDVVDLVLNSPSGKALSTLIELASKNYSRILEKESEQVKFIFPIINFYLTNNQYNPVVTACIGLYLPTLFWIDNAWVDKNLNNIFDKKNLGNFKVAFSGYLLSSRDVYKDLFLYLQDNEIINIALGIEFDNDSVEGRYFIQVILVAYFYDFFNEADLLQKIITKKRIYDINEIVNFVQRLGKDAQKLERFDYKVTTILRIAIDTLNAENIDVETSKVLFDFTRWIGIVENISDELCDDFKLCIKHKENNYYEYFLIENLTNYLEINPKQVGELLFTIFDENKFLSSNINENKDFCQKIVQFLFENDYKEIAFKICTASFEHGYDFLFDLYSKFKK